MNKCNRKIVAGCFIIMTCFLFSSCTSTIKKTWSNTKQTIVTVKEDHIKGIAVTTQQIDGIDKNSIVLVGDKYWFITNSKDFHRLLTLGLTQPFKRSHNIHVSLYKKSKAGFASGVTITYLTENADEQKKLIDFGFQKNYGNSYGYYLAFDTQYYLAPKVNIPTQEHFAKPVKIVLRDNKQRNNQERVDNFVKRITHMSIISILEFFLGDVAM